MLKMHDDDDGHRSPAGRVTVEDDENSTISSRLPSGKISSSTRKAPTLGARTCAICSSVLAKRGPSSIWPAP